MGQIIAPLIHSDDFAKLKNIFLAKNFFLKIHATNAVGFCFILHHSKKIFFKANPEDEKEIKKRESAITNFFFSLSQET